MANLGLIERPFKNVSYLCARDPSILTWGGNLGNIRQNLANELNDKTENCTQLMDLNTEQDTHLQVYLRLKKVDTYESLYKIVDDNVLQCIVPQGAHCARNVREGLALAKAFSFSKIFGPNSLQQEIFNSVIKHKVLRFINGLNSSLLTYGASGSGIIELKGATFKPCVGMVEDKLYYKYPECGSPPLLFDYLIFTLSV